MPTIKLQIKKAPIYLSPDDFDGWDTEDCYYDYDMETHKEAIINVFVQQFKVDKEAAETIIEELELYEIIEDRYYYEIEEEVKELLRDRISGIL